MSIQTDHDGEVHTVDVTVSAHTPIEALLPAVNDAVPLWPPADAARRWRLDRAAGDALDHSVSLAANGIRDGDLLVLTALPAPTPRPPRWDPAHLTAVTDGAVRPCGARLGDAVGCWALLVAAGALAWSGTHTSPLGYALLAACGSVACCWIACREDTATPGVAAAALAASAGFLAVPDEPGAPRALLAASAALAVAAVTARLLARPSAALTATATGATLVSLAAAAATLLTLPVTTVGAVLATSALGALALSPRAAIALSGLHAGGGAGHAALTGLVAGSTAAAAIGAAQVATACIAGRAPAAAGLAFTGATGLVLLLRTSTYVDTPRRAALALGGTSCATATLAALAVTAPGHVYWAAGTLGVLGLGIRGRRTLGPAATRAIEMLDRVALAAVIPLACWVIGVFAFARQLHLT